MTKLAQSLVHIEKKGSGPPLVLFHGWGFDSRIWYTLSQTLMTQYQLYLVDLPGFGSSSYMNWESFKSKLLQRLPERFALLGWSLGGLYATRFALESESRVTHLINVSSSPCFIAEPNWPGISRSAFVEFYERCLRDPEQTRSNFVKQQLAHDQISEFISSDLALRDGLDAMLNWNFCESIKTLNMSTAYVFGRLDEVISRHTCRAMKNRYPQFEYLCIDDAAHVPFLSHQEQFIVFLSQFYLVGDDSRHCERQRSNLVALRR